MVESIIKINDGLEVSIREINAGDIMDATDAAQELRVLSGAQPFLVVNPTKLGWHLLLKSISSISDGTTPTMEWLRGLSAVEFQLLQEKTDELDAAVATEALGKGVSDRGRDSTAS